MDAKRPSAFRLMLTDVEHDALRQIAEDAGVTMSSLIRRVIFGESYEGMSTMYPKEDHTELLDKRIRELSQYKGGPWPV